MSGPSWFSGTTASEEAIKFLQQLENDLRNLSLELKKKYPNPREVPFYPSSLCIFLILKISVVRGGHRQVEERPSQPADARLLRGEPNFVSGAGSVQDQGREGGAAGGGRDAAAGHPAGGGPQVRRPHHRHPLVPHGGGHRGGQGAADGHSAAHN